MTLTNGLIPASLLAPADGTTGARLRVGAAASWNQVRARVNGLYGWWPTITSAGDAYRDLARQKLLFQQNYTTDYASSTRTDRRVWDGRTWWRRPGKPSAATPGTSNHGLGRAVDVAGLGAFDSTKHSQFSAVAGPAGWSDAEGRAIGEPWHWNYTGPLDAITNPGDGVPGLDLPDIPDLSLTPLILREDTMRLLRIREDGRIFVVAAHTFDLVADMDHVNALIAITGPWVEVDVVTAARIHEQVAAQIVNLAASLKGQGL